MPDRPLECSECKRPIAVDYTEVVGKQTSSLSMCAQCPVLQRKLYGTATKEVSAKHKEAAGLACGECGTTLEAVRTGSQLGCPECYAIFEDVIVYELQQAGRVSRRLGRSPSKSEPLHVGRGPGDTPQISPDVKIVALDDALEATLKDEDYEGAAWLRDQIKQAKEKKE
jgi:protein arginine kinase activator